MIVTLMTISDALFAFPLFHFLSFSFFPLASSIEFNICMDN